MYSRRSKMLLRELINETIRLKDEIKQRRTICQVGLINLKEELREIQSRHKKQIINSNLEITEKTDFKELGYTTQKQRDEYIYNQQGELRKEQMEEVNDQKYLIECGEKREKELWDEYKYYEDRFNFLMRVYDIEGEIEIEDVILAKREVVGEADEK